MTLTEFLKSIADAIRAKTGATGSIAATDFPAQIQAIETGIDTSDATATEADVLLGKTFYASDVKKTGTMATVEQATPSVSVDSAGKVTATATQSAGYVAGGAKSGTLQLTTQASKTVTPGTTSTIAVSSGVYTTGDVTVAGDSNLVASNIVKGVSIFGVTGTAAVTTYTACSLKVLNKSSSDCMVHFQTADGSWDSAYVSESHTSTLTTFVGAWAYCQCDGVYTYITVNSGATQLGPGESTAFYTTAESSSICIWN